MKTRSYRLAKQIGQHGFFAVVTIRHDEAVDGLVVDLADTARHSEFGEAALRGVRYALTHISPPVDSLVGRISVTAIEDNPVDTTASAVAFAACYATWDAIDRKPTSEPRFEGVKIVFGE